MFGIQGDGGEIESVTRRFFLAGGQAGLQKDTGSEADGRIEKLQAKVDKLTLANDLLEHKIERMERGVPLSARGSKS
jgi:hypothetical protein